MLFSTSLVYTLRSTSALARAVPKRDETATIPSRDSPLFRKLCANRSTVLFKAFETDPRSSGLSGDLPTFKWYNELRKTPIEEDTFSQMAAALGAVSKVIEISLLFSPGTSLYVDNAPCLDHYSVGLWTSNTTHSGAVDDLPPPMITEVPSTFKYHPTLLHQWGYVLLVALDTQLQQQSPEPHQFVQALTGPTTASTTPYIFDKQPELNNPAETVVSTDRVKEALDKFETQSVLVHFPDGLGQLASGKDAPKVGWYSVYGYDRSKQRITFNDATRNGLKDITLDDTLRAIDQLTYMLPKDENWSRDFGGPFATARGRVISG